MAIYKLIYYTNDPPKKRKSDNNDLTVCEKNFHLNELSSDVQKRLFDLMPYFNDLSNINLTVDFQNVQVKYHLNYTYIQLGHLNDIYYLFGIPIDIESVVYSLGKVYLDDKLSLTENRVVVEIPKLEVCLNNEFQQYYTFGINDTPNRIIQKVYEYYGELIKHLKTKFKLLEARKIEVEEQYIHLKKLESTRLQQLDSLHKQAHAIYEQDKNNWISTQGSKHLRLLYSLNYELECEEYYIKERVEKDFGECVIDLNHQISYNPRSTPSKEALQIKSLAKDKGFDAEIVWIKKGLNEIKEECEAVVIFNYLNKYRLYKKVN